MNIRVHIERLILEGLPAGGLQSGSIGQVVEAELARSLAREGLAHLRPRHEARLAADDISLVRPGDPRQLGKQIGGAIQQCINSMAK
jgi:hypothetical protein